MAERLLAAQEEARRPRVATTAPAVDETSARRTLRGQIAKLERELASLAADVAPRDRIDWTTRGHDGPRLLSLGELERVRDDLAERRSAVRATLAERSEREARQRELVRQMLLDPRRHRRLRIPLADIGEPGCGVWHVRPRLGLIGMLMGWWQVKLSSGCPLAEGRASGPPHVAPERHGPPQPTARRVVR